MKARIPNTTIAVKEFQSVHAGPKILFFGAIHGNEVCGPKAINRVISEIESGGLTLLHGSVTFVPVANPEAHRQDKRFIEDNLNRIFTTTKDPKTYEARLANVLCPLVKRADVVLDIHSITADGNAFTYLDFLTKNNLSLAEVLGPAVALVGWPELYKRIGQGSYSSDTTIYSNKMKKDTLLIECGQHKAPKSVAVAYRAIIATLQHYGMIQGTPKRQKLTQVIMDNVYFRQNQQEQFVKKWKHLDRVKKGQGIITSKDGTVIKAQYDGFIVMPKWNAKDGEDWLYFGRDKK
jgi:predicted deacylase